MNKLPSTLRQQKSSPVAGRKSSASSELCRDEGGQRVISTEDVEEILRLVSSRGLDAVIDWRVTRVRYGEANGFLRLLRGKWREHENDPPYASAWRPARR